MGSGRRLFIFGIVLATLLCIYIRWWRSEEIVVLGNVLQLGALAFAGLALNRLATVGYETHSNWEGWAWLAGGIWLWFLGQLLESYAELVLHQDAYGTVADSFWLLGCFAMIRGLLLHIRSAQDERKTQHIPGLRLMLLFVCGGYTAVVILLIPPHLSDTQQNLMQKILDFAYPALDLACFLFALILVSISHASERPHTANQWMVFGAGIFLGAVADIIWPYWMDTTSAPYRFLDVLYFGDYMLIALAATIALQHSVRKSIRRKI